MSEIKALLFDMDGVLVDAKEWHYEALNMALGLFGITISRYEHLHTFDGLPTRDKLDLLSEQHYLPKSLHPFINQLKQKYTNTYISTKCHPVFCHEYALSRFREEGYKIAVCSNSIRSTIEKMMERSSLLPYIDLIVSNEDVKKAKPDPEMYLTAMEKLNILPAEALVVEDNPNGIEAGKRSGAYVLEVNTVMDVNYNNISNAITKYIGENIG